MKIKSLNVEELSREMKRNKTIAIQEVTERNPRQWLFQGERLTRLHEQNPREASFPDNADVCLVCEDSDLCQQLAGEIADNGWTVRYLAGGHLAWSQFYHPVVVGFDEQVKVWQIHRLSRGCLSYMIASGESAMIVDPCYHIDYYLGLAHAEKTDITCVVDTQIHRDHVSGAARLAAKTGSPYYVPSHEKLQADSRPLEEQSRLTLGDARIEVMVLPELSTQEEQSVGLLINEQFFLSGDHPLQNQSFRKRIEGNPSLRRASDSAIVLPAHVKDLALLNEHGIVAALLGELKNARNAIPETGKPIFVSDSRAFQEEIYDINLSQKKIDLDKATELELGLPE